MMKSLAQQILQAQVSGNSTQLWQDRITRELIAGCIVFCYLHSLPVLARMRKQFPDCDFVYIASTSAPLHVDLAQNVVVKFSPTISLPVIAVLNIGETVTGERVFVAVTTKQVAEEYRAEQQQPARRERY